MSKYTVEGNTIKVDFETEGVASVELDTSTLNDAVKHAAMLFGLQTVMRNSTAGKMDEPVKAREAMLSRISVFKSGAWATEAQAKAAVALTEDERKQVVASVIVLARRAKGDQRADAEILAAFNGLDDNRKGQVIASLQKAIDKRLKDALRQKKVLSKATSTVADF